MKRAVRSLMVFVLAAAAFGAVGWAVRYGPVHWWRQDVIAELDHEIITMGDLRDGLRTYLWRRGLAWEQLTPEKRGFVRQAVLEDLLDRLLLRHHRRLEQPLPTVEPTAAEEFEGWAKQFQADGERTLRMGWRDATDGQVLRDIAEAQADQAWLEQVVGSLLPAVSEQDLRVWFEANAEKLRIPSTYRASHIYLTRHDREKANREPEIQAIHQKLVRRENSFAELAAQYSEDDRTKARGGDLGWFTRDRMPADFMAAIGSLEMGRTSEPVLTALGWHILRLSDLRPERQPSFEEVRAEIEAKLLSEAREKAAAQVIGKLRQRSGVSLWRCPPEVLSKVEPARIHQG